MITLILSILALIIGYIVYSKILDRIFGADAGRITPAVSQADGVDYVVLPSWKSFMIQFLNIAGLGPIFGAVAGAMWGPVAFLWIVLGCLFAGGVHDYFSGMLSLRHQGKSIPDITGKYLGKVFQHFTRVFTLLLLLLVGSVFIMGPANIIYNLTGEWGSVQIWSGIIFLYYFFSTIVPIDKLIGKIYPLFGAALLFMAIGILFMMFRNGISVPELNAASFQNLHHHSESFPVFPMLFLTIACGAVSGFHATQSPMMARCLKNEKQGRGVFFGAMVTEGVVALVWAAISMSFFGGISQLNGVMESSQGNAALVVNEISNSLLGKIGGIIALIGVVAAPVTSGDTAFRSARLVLADFLKYDQKEIKKRMVLTLPLFAIGFFLTTIDFSIVWRYFSFFNQALAAVVLWMITAYLIQRKKPWLIAMIPALFLTAAVVSYIMIAPEGLRLNASLGYGIGVIVSVSMMIWVYRRCNVFLRITGIPDRPI